MYSVSLHTASNQVQPSCLDPVDHCQTPPDNPCISQEVVIQVTESSLRLERLVLDLWRKIEIVLDGDFEDDDACTFSSLSAITLVTPSTPFSASSAS